MKKRARGKGIRKSHLRMYASEMIKVHGRVNTYNKAQLHGTLTSIAAEVPTPVTKPMVISEESPIPRAVVLSKLWTSPRHHGVDEFHSIYLLNGNKTKLRLFFKGQVFFFIKEILPLREGWRSITYSSRTRAMQVFSSGSIVWVGPPFPLDPSAEPVPLRSTAED